MWIREGRFPGPAVLLLALLEASAIMLMLPVNDENAGYGFLAASVLAAVFLACVIFRAGCALTLALAMLVLFAYMVFRSAERFARVRPLFRQHSIMYSIRNHVRLVYALGWCVLAVFTVVVWDVPWLCVLMLFPASSLYGLLVARSVTGRTFFLSRRKEKSVMYLVQGKLKTVPDIRSQEDDGENSEMMKELYAKVLNVMETRRPYLDEEYSLQDLAAAVYTNKTYLSKTINVLSGRNFRQFINYYRIRYSLELLHQNPRMRVDELAARSGFHSAVTYNMAFKLNMSVTPGEYSQRLRSRLG